MHCAGAKSFVHDLRKGTAGSGAPRCPGSRGFPRLLEAHMTPITAASAAGPESEDADLEWLSPSHYGYLCVPSSTKSARPILP